MQPTAIIVFVAVVALAGCTGTAPKRDGASPFADAMPGQGAPATAQATPSKPASPSAPDAGRTPDAPQARRLDPDVLPVYVLPWEDDDGILHGAGYVYTALRPPRWQVDGQDAIAARLTPLQLDERDTPALADAGSRR